MTSPVSEVLGGAASAELRIRYEWAKELRDAMKFRGVTSSDLAERLKAIGVPISRQAIEQWLAAKSSPRPHVQQAIGTVLDMPARSIFKLENMQRAAS